MYGFYFLVLKIHSEYVFIAYYLLLYFQGTRKKNKVWEFSDEYLVKISKNIRNNIANLNSFVMKKIMEKIP